MKISRLPAVCIDRLVLVDQHADKLARRAALDESEVAAARSLMNGHDRADPASILRARNEFPELLKKAQGSRLRADAAQRTASACKAYVDTLPDDAELEEVAAPKANGLDLDGVRAKAAELRGEIARVRNLPPPSDRTLVEGFIDELRRPAVAQIKQMISRWPHFVSGEHIAMGMDRDALAALMTAMAPREAQIDHLCERIDAAAAAAMPPSKRPARIAALEQQLTSLQNLETMFVRAKIEAGDTEVAFDPACAPAVILGLRLQS